MEPIKLETLNLQFEQWVDTDPEYSNKWIYNVRLNYDGRTHHQRTRIHKDSSPSMLEYQLWLSRNRLMLDIIEKLKFDLPAEITNNQ
jgi:hypothetical protein